MEVDGALKYSERAGYSGWENPLGRHPPGGVGTCEIHGEDVLHPGRTEQKLRTTTYSVKVFVNFTRSGFLAQNLLLAE